MHRLLCCLLVTLACVCGACGGSSQPAENQASQAQTPDTSSAANPSAPAAAATAAANSGVEKAGQETGKAIQTADRAMNKALTDPELGDKAAAGVNKLASKLSGALGALDRRGRNAAVRAGLPTQRGVLKSRDARALVIEYSASDQTLTGRYVITEDTTFADEVKIGELTAVTFLRDGDRQIAVSVARYDPEEP
jgi:hypothetical protein